MELRSNFLPKIGVAILLGILVGCDSGGPRRIQCGGTGAFPCPNGMFCDLGKRCGGVDRVGYCAYQPTEECDAEEDTICGCDGVEYSNECLANSAGVSMNYKGSCMKAVPKDRIDPAK